MCWKCARRRRDGARHDDARSPCAWSRCSRWSALATFALIGAALYGVLQRELTRNQVEELNTNLQNLEYSIERVGTLDRWARVQAKMDTLTPADGSVRFWVVGDDPRFQYGRDLAQIERSDQDAAASARSACRARRYPLRTLTKTAARLPAAPAGAADHRARLGALCADDACVPASRWRRCR